MFANIEQQQKAISTLTKGRQKHAKSHSKAGPSTEAVLGFNPDESLSAKSKTAFASELRKLIENQGYKCALTGVHLTPNTAELDHITPIKKGGSNEIENLQWVSMQVNRAKGSMLQSEFIEMCRLVCENAKNSGGV